MTRSRRVRPHPRWLRRWGADLCSTARLRRPPKSRMTRAGHTKSLEAWSAQWCSPPSATASGSAGRGRSRTQEHVHESSSAGAIRPVVVRMHAAAPGPAQPWAGAVGPCRPPPASDGRGRSRPWDKPEPPQPPASLSALEALSRQHGRATLPNLLLCLRHRPSRRRTMVDGLRPSLTRARSGPSSGGDGLLLNKALALLATAVHGSPRAPSLLDSVAVRGWWDGDTTPVRRGRLRGRMA